jgi:hypothetical protein
MCSYIRPVYLFRISNKLRNCFEFRENVEKQLTAYKSGTITKENVNKRGYNKFLEIFNHVKVAINQ